jgi:hypothetical protein
MEEALVIWFKQMSDRELAITDEMIVEKSNEIGKLTNLPEGFKFSSGWLYSWKKRHGVHATVRHGEAAAADQAGVLLSRESVSKVVEDMARKIFTIRMSLACSGVKSLHARLHKGKRQVSKRANGVLQCPSHAMPPALTRGRFL